RNPAPRHHHRGRRRSPEPCTARRSVVITVSNLTVAYDELVAVADVSLHVPPGFVLAVSGPSGAGKSSLLWAIAGAVRAKSGNVEVDGLTIADRPAAAAHG